MNVGLLLIVAVFVFVAGTLTTDNDTYKYNRKQKNDFNYIEFKDEHRWR